MKKDFLKQGFYECETAFLNVLNELRENGLEQHDHYSSGGFLAAWAVDNENTRKILSTIISNFDDYKTYDETITGLNKIDEIGLSGLHEIHYEHFGVQDEIMWDKENDKYTLRCVLEGWDDDDNE